MADAIKLPPLPEPDGVIAAMWNVVRHGPNYDGRQNDVIAAAKAYAERHAAAVSAAARDCRTCMHIDWVTHKACALPHTCTNGDRYEPLPPVRLWRTT